MVRRRRRPLFSSVCSSRVSGSYAAKAAPSQAHTPQPGQRHPEGSGTSGWLSPPVPTRSAAITPVQLLLERRAGSHRREWEALLRPDLEHGAQRPVVDPRRLPGWDAAQSRRQEHLRPGSPWQSVTQHDLWRAMTSVTKPGLPAPVVPGSTSAQLGVVLGADLNRGVDRRGSRSDYATIENAAVLKRLGKRTREFAGKNDRVHLRLSWAGGCTRKIPVWASDAVHWMIIALFTVLQKVACTGSRWSLAVVVGFR